MNTDGVGEGIFSLGFGFDRPFGFGRNCGADTEPIETRFVRSPFPDGIDGPRESTCRPSPRSTADFVRRPR